MAKIKVDLSGDLASESVYSILKAFIEKETGRKVRKVKANIGERYDDRPGCSSSTPFFKGVTFSLEPENMGRD